MSATELVIDTLHFREYSSVYAHRRPSSWVHVEAQKLDHRQNLLVGVRLRPLPPISLTFAPCRVCWVPLVAPGSGHEPSVACALLLHLGDRVGEAPRLPLVAGAGRQTRRCRVSGVLDGGAGMEAEAGASGLLASGGGGGDVDGGGDGGGGGGGTVLVGVGVVVVILPLQGNATFLGHRRSNRIFHQATHVVLPPPPPHTLPLLSARVHSRFFLYVLPYAVLRCVMWC